MNIVSAMLEEESGEFLVLSDESIIRKEWLDVYAMASNNKAPDSWSKVFDEDETLGNAIKEEAKFSV